MHQVITNISLDVNSNNNPTVVTKQHDYNTRFIRVKIFDSNTEIHLDENYTYFFTVARKDGKTKNFSCILEKETNTLLLPLNYWTLEYRGFCDAEVSIVDKNSKLTTAVFKIKVTESLASNEQIEKDDSFDLLVVMINDAKKIKESAEKGEFDGEDGKSAYEIAVENGFIGTEQDWLESLNASLTPEQEDKLNNAEDISNKISSLLDENDKLIDDPNKYVSTAYMMKFLSNLCEIFVDTDLTNITSNAVIGILEISTGIIDDTAVNNGSRTWSATKLYNDFLLFKSFLDNKVEKVIGKGLTTNDFTNDYKSVLDKLPEKYASKDYVEQEIANFDFIKIVTELPETGLINRTYFVPKTDAETNDLYDEYMWVNDKWELISTKQIEVDLSQYYTKTQINNIVNEIQSKIVNDDDITDIESFELADNTEYRFKQELSSIAFTIPIATSEDYITSIVFKSGAIATTITYPDNVKWSGDDISSNKFVPASSKTYEILIYWNGIDHCGIVKGW